MNFSPFARRSKKSGLPPGALVYVGAEAPKATELYAVSFDERSFFEQKVQSLEEALALRSKARYLWLNVDGLQNTDLIRQIGKHFNIHPLALEDILNAEQRPKRDEYDDFLLVVAKALHWTAPSELEGVGERAIVRSEQISLVLGKNFVISFQETVGDLFEGIRRRMSNPISRLRANGPDYLMYGLLDIVVDQYFVALEQFGEALDSLENNLINNPDPHTLSNLYALKRAALFFRRCTWPLREALSLLQHGESRLIKKSTLPFLRDVYSHTVECIDTIEVFREMISSMLDVYLSSASNRMNVVIKVLTIITTIFMPLSLIAGIYGMNFEHIPELHWMYGYPFAIGMMVTIAAVMLGVFRYKRWL